ncbi:uncharacterized protein LOC105438664 [Strongylocentrotus purpuratus]|uniref:Uncharacterized protein n=1 Tax=Strongylocentrotus purpuratus TaxID=7668 RepID=A0A7M7P198_STRPU|nr:uncharacterized protein LOC105438664 [Strongylocentrotus purpuratus]
MINQHPPAWGSFSVSCLISQTWRFAQIQTFKVSHLNLRDDQSASSCLGKFLSLLPHLTDVEIRSSSLHDEFYKEIADRASSSQIHKFQGHDLNLRNNQSASSCMGKFLSLLPHLTDLEIRYCSLHGDFYKEIADRASSCQIQKFKLVYNCNLHAHQSESSCMGKFLSLLPHLIDLEISSCEFHDDFYKEIADRASSCQIQTVNLNFTSRNFLELKVLSDSASKQLAKFIISLPCLTTLENNMNKSSCFTFFTELDSLAASSKSPYFREKRTRSPDCEQTGNPDCKPTCCLNCKQM